MWLIFAFSSAILAGLTTILIKSGVNRIDSDIATAIRTFVVLVFSWLIVLIVGSGSEIHNISSTSMIFLALSGLSTGGSWLCYLKALKLGTVNKVVPIDKMSTVLTMILAIIIFNEPFSIFSCLAMILIASGTLLMVYKKDDSKAHNRAWLFYAVLSAVFASLTSILGKIGVQNVESNLGTAIRTIFVLISAILMVVLKGSFKNRSHIDAKSWKFLVLSGITTGGSWLCYYKALQNGPASAVVPIDKLSIVITVLFSYFYLGEKLSKKGVAGLILIVTGTLLTLV